MCCVHYFAYRVLARRTNANDWSTLLGCIPLGLLGNAAICMFIQLKFMNNGLRLFDVLFVLPIYQAFWISGAVSSVDEPTGPSLSACVRTVGLCLLHNLLHSHGPRAFPALLPVQTINGILFFEEYANFNDTQFFMFPIGCVLTVAGVAALAMKCVG